MALALMMMRAARPSFVRRSNFDHRHDQVRLASVANRYFINDAPSQRVEDQRSLGFLRSRALELEVIALGEQRPDDASVLGGHRHARLLEAAPFGERCGPPAEPIGAAR